jgi:hypothetical protein
MAVEELRFRQIHLDFHTHQDIPGIGADFDPEAFAATLQQARVDSINLFARGHHGYIYYPSKAFPERVHPHLERDLLGEQIEACHRRDIRTPIYITVQWDHYTQHYHPEWRVRTAEGCLEGTPPYQAGFYRRLCLNTPYVDLLKEFTREVIDTLPTDGVWFDIVAPQDCSCRWCLEGMQATGLDPADPAARQAYGREVMKTFVHDMTAFVRDLHDDCLIFYNSGHVGPAHRPLVDAYTHLELESLPSGGWGYLHFPLTMRYARTLGKDCLGMTGKFLTAWGDFHSFKNRAALEFECFTMLALNGKCCVGDQLHPRGTLCPTTYKLIGAVYEEVEKREPWCRGARPVTEIGVLTPEEFRGGGGHQNLVTAAMGAVRLLQETVHQFDMLDSQSDFDPYKLLILPDEIPVDEALAGKLERFVEAGGKVLASHRAGLAPDGEAFGLDLLGVTCRGPAPYSPDFLVPEGPLGEGLDETGHVMHAQALEVAPAAAATTLCAVELPYFNRTWEHFCSHRHAPSSGARGYPAVVGTDASLYFAHPIFGLYQTHAPLWVKTLFRNAVARLLPEPLLSIDAPSHTTTAINEQPREQRWLVHLLNYIPVRRAEQYDIIEEVIPVADIGVAVRTPRPVKRVTCVPEGTELDFALNDGRCEFVLPQLGGYQIVELQF